MNNDPCKTFKKYVFEIIFEKQTKNATHMNL